MKLKNKIKMILITYTLFMSSLISQIWVVYCLIISTLLMLPIASMNLGLNYRTMYLNVEYNINNCTEKGEIEFYGLGPYGIVTKLYKVKDIWIGKIEPNNLYAFLSENNDYVIEYNTGYFVIEGNRSKIFALTHEELNKKILDLPISEKIKNGLISGKIKLRDPYYYLLRFGKDVDKSCWARQIHNRIFY